MTINIYFPPSQQHAYLIVTRKGLPFSIQDHSLNEELNVEETTINNTYVFSIDLNTGYIYSSSVQNVDVFNSLDEAKNFLSETFDDPQIKLEEIGSFLIGYTIAENNINIRVVKEYEKVASIFNYHIYCIKSINLCCIPLLPAQQKLDITSTDTKGKMDNIYFSPSLNLASPFPYHFINELNIKNNNFCFNRNHLLNFVENKLLFACVFLIRGYIKSTDDNNLIYITKFTKVSCDGVSATPLNDPHKYECECELIIKKESPNVEYHCHAWKRGPELCLDQNNQKDFNEAKKYVSKEILSRLNIQKFFNYLLTPIENSNDVYIINNIKNEFHLDMFNNRCYHFVKETTQDKLEKFFNDYFPSSSESTFTTVLDKNGDITSIQNLICRFSSSMKVPFNESFSNIDIFTLSYLKKLFKVANFSDSILDDDFFESFFKNAHDILVSYCESKKSSTFSLFRFFMQKDSDVLNDDNIIHYSKKRFLLDPQHASYSYSMSSLGNTNFSIFYVFPEPFYICDLSFLVSPQNMQKQQTQNQTIITLLIRFSPNSKSSFQLQIPNVNKEINLTYDIEDIMDNSLQYPYDPAYYVPTSTVTLDFTIKNGDINNFTIKDIQIGVKRNPTCNYKFVVPTETMLFPKNCVDFVNPSLKDLINLENARIENKFDYSIKNQEFSKNLCNPWFYDIKSQLYSKGNNNICPFCSTNIKKNFVKVKINKCFDPVLLVIDDESPDENCVHICPECSQNLQAFYSDIKQKMNNFVVVDNSYALSYSMEKWRNPLYFVLKPEKEFDLSPFGTFSNQNEQINECLHGCSSSLVKPDQFYDLHFFTMVNIRSIQIELSDSSKFDQIQVKVKFNQSGSDQELAKNVSDKVFKQEFSVQDNIHLLTFQFLTKDEKKPLIGINKIDIFGSLSSKPSKLPTFKNPLAKEKVDAKFILPSKFFYQKLSANRIQVFNVNFKELYGLYFKAPSKNQAKSVLVTIEDCFSLIIPSFPTDVVFYFPFLFAPSNVKKVYIMYLDCASQINPFEIGFNGQENK